MRSDWRVLVFAASVVVGAWGVFLLITLGVRCGDGSEPFGQMGDAFNILNCLFAGLAFAVVCFQLWVHQKQINEERGDRQRAERINALSTRIQVTFDKILHERGLLLQVAPGFKHVSFLHEGDGAEIGESIQAKEGLVQSITEMLAEIQRAQAAGGPPINSSETLKELWDNQAAIPMMKQIKKWVDQLESYEKEMDGLLKRTR